MGGIGKPGYLDHRRHRTNSSEEFLVRAANSSWEFMSVTYIRVRTTCSIAMPAPLQRLERDRESCSRLPVRITGMQHAVWTGRRRARCDGPVSGHYHPGVAVDLLPMARSRRIF